jgi:hypothetical protein
MRRTGEPTAGRGSGRGSVRPFGVNRDTGATVVLAEHGQGWYDER